jgi:uncharacterized membrane protein
MYSVEPTNNYVRFHAVQSILVSVVFTACWIVMLILDSVIRGACECAWGSAFSLTMFLFWIVIFLFFIVKAYLGASTGVLVMSPGLGGYAYDYSFGGKTEVRIGGDDDERSTRRTSSRRSSSAV